MARRAQSKNDIDPTKPASIIIGRAGGLSAFCRLSGLATSTVWNWLHVGYIPRDREQMVYDLFRANKIRISIRDFSGIRTAETPAVRAAAGSPDDDRPTASPGQVDPAAQLSDV